MGSGEEHVYDGVRQDLAARSHRAISPLAMGGGETVRFYGTPRGERYRVARCDSPLEARRVAYGLRAARRRLGDHVPRVHVDWLRKGIVVTELIPGRVAPRLGHRRLERCVRLLARLHNIDISQERRLGPMRGCFADRLDQLVANAQGLGARGWPRGTEPWLARYQALKRRRWPRVLMHGDPHEENFVWQEDGRPALIDWDLSMPGAPHFDLAYLLYWRGDSLSEQRRPEAWKRAVEWLLDVYNRTGRRRRVLLPDLLRWLGVVALMYVGFGVQLRKTYYVPLGEWIWDRIGELASERGIDLDAERPRAVSRPHASLRPALPRRPGAGPGPTR